MRTRTTPEVPSGTEPVVRERAAAESDRLHGHVQWVLRAGVSTSVLAIVVGMSIRLASGRDDSPAVGLWDLFAHGGDVGLVITAMGILVLALTPALRVVALVALWWRERDYRFVAVALAVVTTLVLSVVLGKG